MTALLTILQRFPKIFLNCSEGQTNVPEHFPKIAEDFRGTKRPEDVLMKTPTNKFKRKTLCQ